MGPRLNPRGNVVGKASARLGRGVPYGQHWHTARLLYRSGGRPANSLAPGMLVIADCSPRLWPDMSICTVRVKDCSHRLCPAPVSHMYHLLKRISHRIQPPPMVPSPLDRHIPAHLAQVSPKATYIRGCRDALVAGPTLLPYPHLAPRSLRMAAFSKGSEPGPTAVSVGS